MMASSNLSPAVFIDSLTTIPPSEITAISDVPPPTSTIMLPVGFEISIPAPIAAAIGSSIINVSFAPALLAASITAFFSTCVTPLGTQTTILGGNNLDNLFVITLSIKYLSIISVVSKSEITPSFKGLIAVIYPGVLPSMFRASSPTAFTSPVFVSIATTEGSSKTIPFPLTNTRTEAVPKSIPISILKPKTYSSYTCHYCIYYHINSFLKRSCNFIFLLL